MGGETCHQTMCPVRAQAPGWDERCRGKWEGRGLEAGAATSVEGMGAGGQGRGVVSGWSVGV